MALGGRGTGAYRKGRRVRSFDEISPGMLLVDYSLQFEAVNLVRVSSLDQTGLNRRIFYWQYVVSPCGNLPHPQAETHAMWAHEFERERPAYELYLAVHKGARKPARRKESALPLF